MFSLPRWQSKQHFPGGICEEVPALSRLWEKRGILMSVTLLGVWWRLTHVVFIRLWSGGECSRLWRSSLCLPCTSSPMTPLSLYTNNNNASDNLFKPVDICGAPGEDTRTLVSLGYNPSKAMPVVASTPYPVQIPVVWVSMETHHR